MQLIIAMVSGILFGVGLTVSQMVNPRKVLDFLDVAAIPTGGWDPSLLMVFVGALPIMFLAFRAQRGMDKPIFDNAFAIPTRTVIDRQLVGGAALFGIGWGMAGLCPGPAVTVLPLAGPLLATSLIYLAALMAGAYLATFVRDDGAPAGTR